MARHDDDRCLFPLGRDPLQRIQGIEIRKRHVQHQAPWNQARRVRDELTGPTVRWVFVSTRLRSDLADTRTAADGVLHLRVCSLKFRSKPSSVCWDVRLTRRAPAVGAPAARGVASGKVDDAALQPERHRFGAVGGVQLLQDVQDAHLDRGFRAIQRGAVLPLSDREIPWLCLAILLAARVSTTTDGTEAICAREHRIVPYRRCVGRIEAHVIVTQNYSEAVARGVGHPAEIGRAPVDAQMLDPVSETLKDGLADANPP